MQNLWNPRLLRYTLLLLSVLYDTLLMPDVSNATYSRSADWKQFPRVPTNCKTVEIVQDFDS